eukprot:10413-Heterococcus_DN1.PRE.2
MVYVCAHIAVAHLSTVRHISSWRLAEHSVNHSPKGSCKASQLVEVHALLVGHANDAQQRGGAGSRQQRQEVVQQQRGDSCDAKHVHPLVCSAGHKAVVLLSVVGREGPSRKADCSIANNAANQIHLLFQIIFLVQHTFHLHEQQEEEWYKQHHDRCNHSSNRVSADNIVRSQPEHDCKHLTNKVSVSDCPSRRSGGTSTCKKRVARLRKKNKEPV